MITGWSCEDERAVVRMAVDAGTGDDEGGVTVLVLCGLTAMCGQETLLQAPPTLSGLPATDRAEMESTAREGGGGVGGLGGGGGGGRQTGRLAAGVCSHRVAELCAELLLRSRLQPLDRMLAMALLANDGQNPGSYYCLIRRRFKRRRKKRSERKGNPGRSSSSSSRDGGCDCTLWRAGYGHAETG